MLTSHILSKYDDWTHFILMNFSKLHRDLLNDEIFCLLRTYRHFHFISLSFFSIVSLPAGLGSSSDLIIIYYYHYMLSCSTNSRSLCNHTESYWSRPERAQRLTAKALFDDFEHIAFFFVSLYPNYEECSEPQRKATTLLCIFSQFLKRTFQMDFGLWKTWNRFESFWIVLNRFSWIFWISGPSFFIWCILDALISKFSSTEVKVSLIDKDQ